MSVCKYFNIFKSALIENLKSYGYKYLIQPINFYVIIPNNNKYFYLNTKKCSLIILKNTEPEQNEIIIHKYHDIVSTKKDINNTKNVLIYNCLTNNENNIHEFIQTIDALNEFEHTRPINIGLFCCLEYKNCKNDFKVNNINITYLTCDQHVVSSKKINIPSTNTKISLIKNYHNETYDLGDILRKKNKRLRQDSNLQSLS